MKINAYCQDCGVPIKFYNQAKRCWLCWKKYRKKDAKWLVKFCIDCGKQLSSKQPKTKRCVDCAHKHRQKHYYCINCGIEISTKYSKRCKPCSTKGELNPAWLGGSSYEEYGQEFDENLKEQIRFLNNYKCVICGCSQLENGRQLDVHHIDKNKKNNQINNLIALCIRCHSHLHNSKNFKEILRNEKND
jgi:hypothetical protein